MQELYTEGYQIRHSLLQTFYMATVDQCPHFVHINGSQRPWVSVQKRWPTKLRLINLL